MTNFTPCLCTAIGTWYVRICSCDSRSGVETHITLSNVGLLLGASRDRNGCVLIIEASRVVGRADSVDI